MPSSVTAPLTVAIVLLLASLVSANLSSDTETFRHCVDASSLGEVAASGTISVLEPAMLDPTQLYFHIYGTEANGEFNITQRDPASYCVGDDLRSCGKQAQDSTLMGYVRDGVLSLNYLSNNPTVTPYGKVLHTTVEGSYLDGYVHVYTHTTVEVVSRHSERTYIVRSYVTTSYFGTVVNGALHGMMLDSAAHYFSGLRMVIEGPYLRTSGIGTIMPSSAGYSEAVRHRVRGSRTYLQGSRPGSLRVSIEQADNRSPPFVMYKITIRPTDHVANFTGIMVADAHPHEDMNFGLLVHSDGLAMVRNLALYTTCGKMVPTL